MMQHKKLLLDRCPITLQNGHSAYSAKGLRQLFSGKKVAHHLPYFIKDAKKEQRKFLHDNRVRISISGVQEKFSLRQVKNKLTLSQSNGTHILKPIPSELENVAFVPANEHLTMQIASQVFKLNVAANGLIFFADDEIAYITKRFDVMADGVTCLVEDFASLLQVTTENKNFKYDASYLDIADAIDQYIPTNIASKEELFKLIVFNYLFSNGDAHLKNFSVIDYRQDGFYQLAPAYDLLCTRLHIDDSDLALNDGLYVDDYKHPSFSKFGFYANQDFFDFGIKIGLVPKRITSFLQNFLSHQEKVVSLVRRSFLNLEMQDLYLGYYKERRRKLGMVE